MQGSGAVGFCQLVLVGQGAVSVGVSPVERDNLLLSCRRSFVKQKKAWVQRKSLRGRCDLDISQRCVDRGA